VGWLDSGDKKRKDQPMEFKNVTAVAAGNVYFDGKVISHTILMPDASKKTLGVIMPGSYHFGTEAAEIMEMAKGGCSYVLDGSEEVVAVPEGSRFQVPAHSGFTITVEGDPCHYVCSFIV
jgi:purine/pyrimidine-nucleoside phosphorylase